MPCFATLSCSDGSPSRCKKKGESYRRILKIAANWRILFRMSKRCRWTNHSLSPGGGGGRTHGLQGGEAEEGSVGTTGV